MISIQLFSFVQKHIYNCREKNVLTHNWYCITAIYYSTFNYSPFHGIMFASTINSI